MRDLGSGGAVLVGNRVVGGGKDGLLYLVNAADMSHVQSFQAFIDADNWLGTDTSYGTTYSYNIQWYAGPNIHGAPVAWDVSARRGAATAYIYGWSEKDSLKRFEIDNGYFASITTTAATPWNPTPTPHGEVMSAYRSMPGAMLSLSANGANGGVIWATVEEPYGCAIAPLKEPDGRDARARGRRRTTGSRATRSSPRRPSRTARCSCPRATASS